jgi:hypothetical protein
MGQLRKQIDEARSQNENSWWVPIMSVIIGEFTKALL